MSDSGVCSDRGRALTPVLAAAQSTNTTALPRTPWGAPDLQGVWDFRSITPLERPASLADKEFLTEEEAANLEQEAVDRNERLLHEPAERAQPTRSLEARPDGKPGFYNNFWLDEGTTTVGTRRTSLIVDPPEGKIPPLTPAAQEKQAAIGRLGEGLRFTHPLPAVGSRTSAGAGCSCVASWGKTPDRR